LIKVMVKFEREKEKDRESVVYGKTEEDIVEGR
jgi:hypothetical protein